MDNEPTYNKSRLKSRLLDAGSRRAAVRNSATLRPMQNTCASAEFLRRGLYYLLR